MSTASFPSAPQGSSVLQMSEVCIPPLPKRSRSDYLGKLSLINSMAKKVNAQYVIHTGDFGFYDDESLDRMNEKYVALWTD